MTDNTTPPPFNDRDLKTVFTLFNGPTLFDKLVNYTPSLKAFRFSDGSANYAIDVFDVFDDLTVYLFIERSYGWVNADPENLPLATAEDITVVEKSETDDTIEGVELLTAIVIERANKLLKILQGGEVERSPAENMKEAILNDIATRFRPHQGMDGVTILNPRN